MLGKTSTVEVISHVDGGQSNSVMVNLPKYYGVNTALNVYDYKNIYWILLKKFQILNNIGIQHSPQPVGQYLLPKTEICVQRRNAGFPKGSNSYLVTRELKYPFRTTERYGNGGCVVRCYSTFKGIQPNYISCCLSGRKFYSTEQQDIVKDVVKHPIEVTYKQLFDINIYKESYDVLKSKPGNMTPGTDNYTLDGISKDWMNIIIQQLKDRSFQFKPSNIIYIPKPNGKLRPLGIPSPRDKIIQQAIRMIFESVFEPLFLNSSHGFRPKRSPHTAILEVRKWNGITWMIEGDIKGYFDNINHEILANLLKKEIKDSNLIDLYWKLVKAGYINNGRYQESNLGVPQGGVLSPLLSNIYLHEFDKFMVGVIDRYSTNKPTSRPNEIHTKKYEEIIKLRKKPFSPQIKILQKELIKIPSVIRDNNTGTKVYYNRFADDWIIGVTGPLALAETIKQEVTTFLKFQLKLTLSEEKTKITHLGNEKAKYLGFEIFKRNRKYTESLIKKTNTVYGRRRSTNQGIIVYAPMKSLIEKLENHGFAKMVNGKIKPCSITKWIFMNPYDIILRYNALLRGTLRYYTMVENRNQFSYFNWIILFSCAFTLSRKWNVSPPKVFQKLGKTLKVTEISKTTGRKLEVSLAIPKSLAKEKTINVGDYTNFDPFKVKYFEMRSHHIWDECCKLCGSEKNIQIHHVRHHVRHIRKGNKSTNKTFTNLMSKLNRKQIPVCHSCHMKIHNGSYNGVSLRQLKENSL